MTPSPHTAPEFSGRFPRQAPVKGTGLAQQCVNVTPEGGFSIS